MKNLYFFLPILFCLFLTLGYGQSKPKVHIQIGHESSIKTLSFSYTGNYLLSGDASGVVKIWDVQSGKIVKTTSCLGGRIRKIVPHPKKLKYLVQQD